MIKLIKRLLASILYYLKDNRGFARVTGPLFSMSASGTLGKAVTYASWKGQPYARKWFIPENPSTAGQVNVRKALTLLIAEYQTETQARKDAYEAFAEGTGMSGFNQYVSRGMDQYVIQLGTSTEPTSVAVDDVNPPAETWTWT